MGIVPRPRNVEYYTARPLNQEREPMPQDAPQNLRVAIIEDDEVVRRSFVSLINGTPGMMITGDYSCCEDALKDFEKNLPHILLTDIGLPGMDGIEGARLLKERHPFVDILMITVYDDDEKIFKSICAGASGYVLKNADPAELINAIKEIQTGAPMSAAIARRVLGMVRQQAPPQPSEMNLTPRETEILHSLVDGASYKKIGEKLFISPLTVHSHIKRIYEKLQVHSRGEAVSKALKHRLFN